MIKCHRSVLSN